MSDVGLGPLRIAECIVNSGSYAVHYTLNSSCFFSYYYIQFIQSAYTPTSRITVLFWGCTSI